MTLSGAPIQLAYLVQWLRARDWETTIVAPEPGPLSALLTGVDVIYEAQLLIDPYYGALRRLAPRFDVVVANTIATWEAVQACHLERVPVIWYIHETQVGVHLMQLVHMIEPSLSLADAIVAPTRKTAAVYAPFVAKQIAVIPYGIPEVAVACPAGERLRFVTIGTFEHRKGQDVLLAALPQLPPAVRERASFQLAGRNLEEPFHAELRRQSESLGNVAFVGALEHDAALELLARADVLLLPSRDETMPLVLLEAMSLRKAIVCTRVGGIEEWISDGENGLVVPPDDPAALAAAIAKLIEVPDLGARLGAAARHTYEQHFTVERYGSQFAQLIEQTIVGYPAPTA